MNLKHATIVKHIRKWQPSPVRMLSFALGATSFTFILFSLYCWETYRHSELVESREFSRISLSKTMQQLDKVLPESTIIYLSSDDAVWEKRNLRHQSIFKDAIEKAMQIEPNFRDDALFNELRSSNQSINRIEKHAIGLFRQGNQKTASSILRGREYTKLKKLRSKGLRHFSSVLHQQADLSLNSHKRWTHTVFVGALIVLTILVLIWVKAISGVRRILEKKSAFEKVLKRSHGKLVQRASDRTVELEAINKKLTKELTERKNMEAQLRISERMASMGTLTAGVAHEINNPLSYVIINLKLSLQALDELTMQNAFIKRDEMKEMLTQADGGAERVRRIVRDMKAFSRPEREQEEDKGGPCDVQKVIEASLHMAANEIRHRAKVICDFQKIPLVHAGEARLGQVFLNLLVNAAQALPDGEAENYEIKISTQVKSSKYVQIQVQDNGPGIPEEFLSRVFDPFFTTKPVGVGTGLGLSICHRIVTSYEGSIEIKCPEEGGTIVNILLPISKDISELDHKNTKPIAQASKCKKGRVLIIDDEAIVAKSLKRLLSQHEVVLAQNGADALDILREDRAFDVIFCDLMMPDKTGMDVYEVLQASCPSLASKIVFMTGGAFSRRSKTFLDQVKNPHLEKPFDIQAVFSFIQKFVGQEQMQGI